MKIKITKEILKALKEVEQVRKGKRKTLSLKDI